MILAGGKDEYARVTLTLRVRFFAATLVGHIAIVVSCSFDECAHAAEAFEVHGVSRGGHWWRGQRRRGRLRLDPARGVAPVAEHPVPVVAFFGVRRIPPRAAEDAVLHDPVAAVGEATIIRTAVIVHGVPVITLFALAAGDREERSEEAEVALGLLFPIAAECTFALCGACADDRVRIPRAVVALLVGIEDPVAAQSGTRCR